MKNLWLIVFLVCCCPFVSAQDAVPGEILNRTIYISYGNEAGTAFKMDYQGTIYLVTAKHVVAGVPQSGATIRIRQEGEWKDYHTVRTIYPFSPEVDIAIFETEEKLTTPYLIGATGSVTFGQPVWFVGFPFGGLGTRWRGGSFAFIKRGTLSAMDSTNPDAIVLYIDGFNNSGFSGGPIVCWDFSKHVYEIIGVVQGYKPEAAKALINGQPVDTQILVNSGILVSYSIEHAIKAIEANQKKSETH
jgi:hypothetical protein